jgi:hypothetical protein
MATQMRLAEQVNPQLNCPVGRQVKWCVPTGAGDRINVGEPLIVFKAPDITADYGHGPEG